MNTHEATDITVEGTGEVTYVSTCAGCNRTIVLPEYYDEDRGTFTPKNWAVVTWHNSEKTAGVRYARYDTKCLPELV